MLKRMKELDKILNIVDYGKLWDRFEKKRYAIYNDENFIINDNLGLDMKLRNEDSFFVGNTDERFLGNTAILIDDNYIAIWDDDYIFEDTDSLELASLIIHEMFHCFQSENNEKRFPDELLGIDYPITLESIKLRTLERQYLLSGSFEKDKKKKKELINSFYSVRSKREKLLGDTMDYEKAIESVEGTAVYVEYKTLTQLYNKDDNVILKEYTKGFEEVNQENLKVRASTYSQGLLLGLIADEYLPEWKKDFQNSDEYLSDFIKNKLDIKKIEIHYENKDIDIEGIEECINKCMEERDKVFEDFQEEARSNNLEQGFKVTGFDPMNIVKRNQEIIHKNFLRIKIGEDERVIKGPVKAIIGQNLFDVKKIQW